MTRIDRNADGETYESWAIRMHGWLLTDYDIGLGDLEDELNMRNCWLECMDGEDMYKASSYYHEETTE